MASAAINLLYNIHRHSLHSDICM